MSLLSASGLGDKTFYRHKAAKVILARANRETEAAKPRIEDAIPVSHDEHFVAALTEQVLRLDSHPIDT